MSSVADSKMDISWDMTEENRPTVVTNLSQVPFIERIRLTVSIQALYAGAPLRVYPPVVKDMEPWR